MLKWAMSPATKRQRPIFLKKIEHELGKEPTKNIKIHLMELSKAQHAVLKLKRSCADHLGRIAALEGGRIPNGMKQFKCDNPLEEMLGTADIDDFTVQFSPNTSLRDGKKIIHTKMLFGFEKIDAAVAK